MNLFKKMIIPILPLFGINADIELSFEIFQLSHITYSYFSLIWDLSNPSLPGIQKIERKSSLELLDFDIMKRTEKVIIFIILSFFGKITNCKSKNMERLRQCQRDRDICEKHYRQSDYKGNTIVFFYLRCTLYLPTTYNFATLNPSRW